MGKKKQNQEKKIHFDYFVEEIKKIDQAGLDEFIAHTLKSLWYYIALHKFEISAIDNLLRVYETGIHYMASHDEKEEDYHQKMEAIRKEFGSFKQSWIQFCKEIGEPIDERSMDSI
jgi:hypothetical protein